MYEALPFDREETVHLLGQKLFTRIKAETSNASSTRCSPRVPRRP